jgi:pimeloyl-ACP methyl ester carboxylesterase
VTPEDKIRQAEEKLFEASGLVADTSMVDLPRTGARLRVLSFGSGPPVLTFHGVTQCAAIWAPLLGLVNGFRFHAVDLPGHGLSSPVAYRRGQVRGHTVDLIDDLYESLSLGPTPVVAHSLGGMFALWHAAARPGQITSLAVLGSPAVALPGSVVRMPLSLLTVPVVGPAILGSPSPRPMYRQLFAAGNGAPAHVVSDELVDVLRLAVRRRGNPRSIGSLLHAIDGFRRPRPESVMDPDELGRVAAPTLFIWGTRDPYLLPGDARPSIALMPDARLREVPAGHAPWLEDAAGCAEMVTHHLVTTGSVPADVPSDPG